MAIHQDFNFTSRSDGGPQTSDVAWSQFMRTYNYGGNDQSGVVGPNRTVSWQVYFNNTGYQRFYSAVDDEGRIFIDGYVQATMGGYGGQTLIQTSDVIVAGLHTITAESNNTGGGPWGVALQWIGWVAPPVPTIDYYYALPNPQTSGSTGTPSNTSTLYWRTFLNYQTVPRNSLPTTSINQGVGSVNPVGSTLVNTGLQSISGSLSPATKTYTLSTSFGTSSTSSPVTISVYNDNTPNNYTVPNRSNLEPATLTTISVGQITGIDMITVVNGGSGVQVSRDNSTWASTILISNGDNLWVRALSPAFNTDPSGLTNSFTYTVTVGTISKNFTLTTRAPDVSETFNLPNKDDKLPYPDIDTIAGSPDQYIISDPITVDDVEIDVELKTNNSNVQVRVKNSGSTTFGSWQDVRSI